MIQKVQRRQSANLDLHFNCDKQVHIRQILVKQLTTNNFLLKPYELKKVESLEVVKAKESGQFMNKTARQYKRDQYLLKRQKHKLIDNEVIIHDVGEKIRKKGDRSGKREVAST